MNEQLLSLIEMQQVDSAIDRVNIQKKVLPEKIAELENSLSALKNKVEDRRSQFDDLTKRHREKEDTLRKGIENLKKTKARQFEVKTNKEYEAVLKEIDILEGKNSRGEDEIIMILEEIDRAKTNLQVTEKEFEALRRQYEKDKDKLTQELNSLDASLEDLQLKSQDLKRRIENDLLRRYEAIKNVNYGSAVTTVWKAVCQGCRMNIPPQLYNELQWSTEIKFCPNCNRIIYWDDRKTNG